MCRNTSDKHLAGDISAWVYGKRLGESAMRDSAHRVGLSVTQLCQSQLARCGLCDSAMVCVDLGKCFEMNSWSWSLQLASIRPRTSISEILTELQVQKVSSNYRFTDYRSQFQVSVPPGLRSDESLGFEPRGLAQTSSCSSLFDWYWRRIRKRIILHRSKYSKQGLDSHQFFQLPLSSYLPN